MSASKTTEIYRFAQRLLEYNYYETVLGSLKKHVDGIELLVPNVGNVLFYPRLCCLVADSPESCRLVGAICSPVTSSPCRVCTTTKNALQRIGHHDYRDQIVSRDMMKNAQKEQLRTWECTNTSSQRSQCREYCSFLSLNEIEVFI